MDTENLATVEEVNNNFAIDRDSCLIGAAGMAVMVGVGFAVKKIVPIIKKKVEAFRNKRNQENTKVTVIND